MKLKKGATYHYVSPNGPKTDIVFVRYGCDENYGFFKTLSGNKFSMLILPEAKFTLIKEPPAKKKFNMVYTHSSEHNPKKRMPSFKGACKAAERLAKKNPGQKFYVVTSQLRFHVPEGQTEVICEGW